MISFFFNFPLSKSQIVLLFIISTNIKCRHTLYMYMANVELLSNKIELFQRQFKEMLHIIKTPVVLTKRIKPIKHRFIFNLYINNRIMPKLVTYSITLQLFYFFTYFIVSHTHLGKKTESKRTARCAYMCNRGTAMHFLLINPKYDA